MNYLSDNIECVINGAQTRIAILIEDGHVIFFQRSHRSGALDKLIVAGASAVGGTTAIATLPIAIIGLAALALKEKFNKARFASIINEIKTKFKLSDDQVFVSHPGNCLVTLSGRSIPFFSTCAVRIIGEFIAASTTQQLEITITFDESPSSIAKIFGKGDIQISYEK